MSNKDWDLIFFKEEQLNFYNLCILSSFHLVRKLQLSENIANEKKKKNRKRKIKNQYFHNH